MKLLQTLSPTSKRMMKIVCIVAFAFAIIAAIILRDLSHFTAFGRGLLLGTVFTLLKVVLLENTINKTLSLPQGSAANYARLHFVFRYILTGVVLAGCAVASPFSLYGAVVGLITLQIAAYSVSKWPVEKK